MTETIFNSLKIFEAYEAHIATLGSYQAVESFKEVMRVNPPNIPQSDVFRLREKIVKKAVQYPKPR